ncbi:MAG: Omp28-related outer membrane protein [Bacteroidota bacterium]|nr:Omp28-related outer membrane protein [Bacteroidota bacterium]
MKKKLLYIVFIFCAFNLGAQTIVGTAPENKNVVLEEFTGISCGFCPDGHRIGQLIHDQNPGDVVLINIHTGSYATPQGPGTDFNTSFGSAIASQSNLSGYPAGTVNRHQFSMSQGGGTAMSRGDWTSAANQILATPSPVNIGIQGNVDMSSGELTVEVELYYTGWGGSAPFSNKLHVALLQNNIEGPQSGSSANPTAVLPNGNYNHQHMLRHILTGQWGEQINTISTGTLVQRSYTWTLPPDINNVNLDPTNLTVAAFVSEGNQEIYTGAESTVTVNFPNSYDAYCMSASASDILCTPTTDLEVSFRNYGNIPLTSLDIEYVINGGVSNTYAWTGNLGPAATETVIIPGVSLSPNLTNTVDFSLSNPNGTTDQNPNNNTASASFAGLTPASTGNATIDVTTDQYANETSWTLKDGNGTVIAFAALGSMTNSSAQPTVTVTLNPNECYSFTISDSYGDGIFAPGGYTITDASGTIIASMSTAFTTEQQTNFSTSPPPAPSWDCISAGNCQDPGTGNGQYNSYTQCMVACVSTDINEENEKNSITIYPNPASEIIHIRGDYESLEIYDILGKKIYSTNNIEKDIAVNNFKNGMYIINITTKDDMLTKKLTIEK